MNYLSKFDPKATSADLAAHSHAYVNVDSSQVHAPADAIIVPDAQLLFHADYKRAGADLILSKDSHEFVLHDYFKGGHRAPLASRDGAHLTADIVKALVGEVDVAQAANNPAARQAIGHVTKMQGSATVIRNGVSIILNMGDNVEKGDVVQSGSSSTVGITFIDGTVFGLSSNARMVLNEMVYDPNGSNNSSLLSLVAGTVSFVAGETAKHGDMKIDTPVATMGIRGTAVLVEIDFSIPGQNGQPNASFQVLVEPDGTTGSYILFDKTTLQPIAIVNQAGQQLNINNGIISQTTTPLSPELQKLITDVFQQKFTDNSDNNTKTNSPSNDSITPQQGPLIKFASGATALPIFVVVNTSTNSTTSTQLSDFSLLQHVPGAPIVHVFNAAGQETTTFATAELNGQTGSIFPDSVGGRITFQDINAGDRPAVTADFSSATYTNASGSFTIANGQTSAPGLSSAQLADISAAAIKLFMVPDLGNANSGTVNFIYSLPEKALDFLAAGEKITLTYQIAVSTNFAPTPETTTTAITVTIVGSNDNPTVSATSAAISRPTGEGENLFDHISGTISFADADLTDRPDVGTKFSSLQIFDSSHHDITATLSAGQLSALEVPLTLVPSAPNSNDGNLTWSYSVPDSALDFLAPGEKLVLTYDAHVDDGHGGIADAPITITINGPPTIVGEFDPSMQAVVVVNPVIPSILGPGQETNALGLNTEAFDGQPVGSTSNNGAGFGDFLSVALDAAFHGAGDAGVVNGSSGSTAAPFIGPDAGHIDTTNYLSIGAGGTETITFASKQDAFGLYWGSVDPYNHIDFYNGDALVASYTGADISPLLATGNQGTNASNGYVEFVGLLPFDKVILSSSQDAFEIDNISAGSVSAPHAQLSAPVSGSISVQDADVGNSLTASVIGTATINLNGSSILPGGVDASGLISASDVTFDTTTSNGGTSILHWSYQPNANFDFLKAGDVLTLQYMAQVNDGQGVVGTQSLTISIVGADKSADMSAFQVVNGTTGNDTFDNVGNNVTVFGGGGQNNFVFKANFGSATIGDFDVNKDTVEISHSLFSSVSEILASAQASPSGNDTIITDASHDLITLTGVKLAQVLAHPNDFHLV